ncbi:MAG: TrmH family RNA methyltransferase [Gemmatimonadota bacterium]
MDGGHLHFQARLPEDTRELRAPLAHVAAEIQDAENLALHADDVAVLHWLLEAGVAIWATAMDGESIAAGAPTEPVALILGNEGAGVRADLKVHATRKVAIPIQPIAESLNVAVAAGILLHQVTR